MSSASEALLSPDLPSPTTDALRWTNRLAALGGAFFTRVQAQGLPQPRWLAHSADCAASLGLPADWATRTDLNALQVLSGNALWPGMQPLATVYSGHQFGVWAGQLGDGRALLLGELATPAGPMEIQLKGAGLTPYSRMGDGRAVLRSTVREFLCSEAMHHLGIPTTRALCMTASDLPVRRETVETAAVLTRVAPSFLRFGHFEHFAHHGLHDDLRRLADFTIDAHFPACRDEVDPVPAMLATVARRTAELMAQWQAVGFCHGVMNTDNMSMLGLTIDYGPFGFLDAFDPMHVCNHSDDRGRYAFARQPNVAFWNLHALAQALLPLVNGDSDRLLPALEPYREVFPQALQTRLRAKLGLATARDEDAALVDDLLRRLAADRVDYTIAFRRLCAYMPAAGPGRDAVRDLFLDREAFDAWTVRYDARLALEPAPTEARAAAMCRVNPKFVLRNHLAETAIQEAQAGDPTEVMRLLKVLQRPYDEQPESARDADFPPAWAGQLEVSCSS